MNASGIAPPSPTDLHQAVEQRIAGYRSTRLAPEHADIVLPRLRDLVRAAQPASPERVKSLLSSACTFLADVATDDRRDVESLLLEANVAR